MPRDPHRFVDAISTRYGVRLAVKPDAINDVWCQNPEISETMMRSRAELMSVRTRDAAPRLPGATVPPSHRKAFATDDLPLDTEELPNGHDDRIIAELPPLDDDDTHYELEPNRTAAGRSSSSPARPTARAR